MYSRKAILRNGLDVAVDYLTERGYEAHWEDSADGYVLHTSNCPYHHISESNPALCEMDLRLVASLLGRRPAPDRPILQREMKPAPI